MLSLTNFLNSLEKHTILKNYILLAFYLLVGSSCSQKIYPDRSQFIGDGDFVPRVNLCEYRSVQERPHQNDNLALALAISGGGSRASNFAMGVMLGLEQIILENGYNALQEVDYLSTVSGGGFAGGTYINMLYKHYQQHPEEPFLLQNHLESVKSSLGYAYMTSLIKANLNPCLLFSLLDDGDILEREIDDHVLGYDESKKSILLEDIFIDAYDIEREVLLPMMFANATVYDKMVLFPFAPDILEAYQITGFTHRLKRVTGVSPARMPLSVGIKASGSFPALISNSTLISTYHKKRRFLHLMDGALIDNLGYVTALEILKQETTDKKVLLVVDADNAGNKHTFSTKEQGKFSVSVFGRLPASGIDARRAVLESELENLGDFWGFKPLVFSFNQLIRNNPVPPPKVIKKVKEEQKRLIQLLATNMAGLPYEDMQILYDLLVNISTKYNITKEEQALLLLAGQKVALMQKEAIIKAMED